MLKTLYRCSYDGIIFHYLSNLEAREVLKEAHNGICGASKLKDQFHQLGYYWPIMIVDAVEYTRRCKACQIYADFIYQTSELLHPTVASWPFEAWEIDVAGPTILRQ